MTRVDLWHGSMAAIGNEIGVGMISTLVLNGGGTGWLPDLDGMLLRAVKEGLV